MVVLASINYVLGILQVDGDLQILCTGLLQKASALMIDTDAYLQATAWYVQRRGIT